MSHLLCLYFPRKKTGVVSKDIVKLLLEVPHAQNKERRLVFSFLSLNYLLKKQTNKQHKKRVRSLLMHKCNYRGMFCFDYRFGGPIPSAAPLVSSPSPPPQQKRWQSCTSKPSQFGIACHLVVAMERAELGMQRRAPWDHQSSPATTIQPNNLGLAGTGATFRTN